MATNKPRAQAGRTHPPEAAVAAALASQAAERHPTKPGATLKTSTGTDELVLVHVPKQYNFVTPDHITHTYAPGEQNMRRSIAEATYSKSNGVEIIGDAE